MLLWKSRLKLATIPCLLGYLSISCGSKDFNRKDAQAETEQLAPNLIENEPDENDPAPDSSIDETLVKKDEQKRTTITKKKEEPKGCIERVLDFDRTPGGREILAGEKITNQYRDWGVTIEAKNSRKGGPNVAITFDSSYPTGNDDDLMTPGYGPGNDDPLYNLLIIPENIKDRDGDGLVDDPNDAACGGKFIFRFDEPTEIRSIDFIDIDKKKAYVKIYDANGRRLNETTVPKKGDNSVQTIRWSEKPKASKVEVILNGSGALDNFRICVDGKKGEPDKDKDKGKDKGKGDEPGKGKDDESGKGKDGKSSKK